MTISFQGTRNVGGYGVCTIDPIIEKPIPQYMELNVELTNDGYGRDLDNFERILKKYPNEINNRFLTFEYTKGGKNIPEGFYLNMKPLKMNDENLPIFEKLVKLLDKVSEKDDTEMKTNRDYLTSNDCAFFYQGLLNFINPKDRAQLLEKIHEPETAKNSAKGFSNFINEKICDYMA